jgi:hypothetical protein
MKDGKGVAAAARQGDLRHAGRLWIFLRGFVPGRLERVAGLTVVVAAYCLGLTGAGCVVSRGRVELGPLSYTREVPGMEKREQGVLWPLFHCSSTRDSREYAFRPLFDVRVEHEGRAEATTELQALWPLILYRKRPDEFRVRLFPVFHYTDYRHPDGVRDVDWALLPLVFGGTADRQGSYCAVFPLGGVLEGLLGKDRIEFVLFPLFAHARDGEHRSWNVLWPFFQYGHGGGRTSYRAWPLFGRKWKEGSYHREFLFWPLVVHQREREGLERPTESWFFLPFYGNQQTPFGRIQYWLFPFFSYQRNERPGNRFREWNAPYPFFSVAYGDRRRKVSLFPFWGRNVVDRTESIFALYPFYWSLRETTGTSVERRYWVLPFYWSRDLAPSGGEGGRERFVKLWPFLDYELGAEGVSRVRALSPLWFRDPEGLERNYSVFWQWYEETRQPAQGVLSRRILWFSQHRAAKVSSLEGVGKREPAPSGAADLKMLLEPFAAERGFPFAE